MVLDKSLREMLSHAIMNQFLISFAVVSLSINSIFEMSRPIGKSLKGLDLGIREMQLHSSDLNARESLIDIISNYHCQMRWYDFLRKSCVTRHVRSGSTFSDSFSVYADARLCVYRSTRVAGRYELWAANCQNLRGDNWKSRKLLDKENVDGTRRRRQWRWSRLGHHACAFYTCKLLLYTLFMRTLRNARAFHSAGFCHRACHVFPGRLIISKILSLAVSEEFSKSSFKELFIVVVINFRV